MKPCLVLSHQLHCRNWLSSGMVRKMTDAGIYGTVLMPAALMVESLEHGPTVPIGWDVHPLEPWIATGWKAKALEALRLGMLVSGARRGGVTYSGKVQAKRKPVAAAEVLAWRILSQATDPLPVVRAIGRALPALHEPFPSGCTHLILPTMIHEDTTQAGIVQAARRAGVPILAVASSWDTLTTKGAFLDQPDRLAVWGPASARHAVEFHGLAPGQVTITGPPHFWPYSQSARIPNLVMSYGTRHIVFAGTTVNYAADELHIIRALGDALRDNPATKDIAIIYRPHPRRHIAPHEYEGLKGHHVVMDPRWRGGWSSDPADIPWIRTICEPALCTISAFSTVVLESALVGTPSILIGFGDSAHGTGKALDHAQYEHMAEMIGKPGIYLAKDLGSVVGTIRQQDPQHRGDAIRAWALDLAAVDRDPRDSLIDWIKESA